MKLYIKTSFLATLVSIVGIFGYINLKSLPNTTEFSKTTEQNTITKILKSVNQEITNISYDSYTHSQIVTLNNKLTIQFPQEMKSSTWLGILLYLNEKTTIDKIEFINLSAAYPYATAKNN